MACDHGFVEQTDCKACDADRAERLTSAMEKAAEAQDTMRFSEDMSLRVIALQCACATAATGGTGSTLDKWYDTRLTDRANLFTRWLKGEV